jgi:putative FmdB family regulatory protein
MPTYEYVCKSCGHLFEIIQSMRDDPLKECPQCGGELRKIFTAPAISFKGSGFYATDARKSSAASKDKKTPSEGGASDTRTETKTDTKTDKKSEKKSDTAASHTKGSGSSD